MDSYNVQKLEVFMFVLFDMDGVLVDSEPQWKLVEQEVLASIGIHMEIEELKKHAGATTFDFMTKIKRLYPEKGLVVEEMVDQVTLEMEKRLIQLPLMRGVEAFIDQLQSDGVPMAIASSSATPLIEAVIKTHNLPITVYASGSELGLSKPHPEVFLQAAKLLCADPWQVLIIEDSVNGTIAGKAASMSVAVVPESFPPRAELAIANHAFESMIDVHDFYRQGGFDYLA